MVSPLRKIADIDRARFLDASVLGETVHPQNFNTLRRIRDEDGSVIDEVQVDTLRKAYKDFQGKRDVQTLLVSVEELRGRFGEQQPTTYGREAPDGPLRCEDLKLICFDFVSGG